jgi:hypothetical protein
MLFSPTDLKSEHWLPQIPDIAAGKNIDEDYKILAVKLHQLATVNGLPNLQSYLSISGDVQKFNMAHTNGNIFIYLLFEY